MANNGLAGIISIFGLVFGIFLAVIGIGLVQDLVVTMNTETAVDGKVCASNPVPIANWFQPEICQEVGGDITTESKVTITGIGLILLVSMLMLIFFIIFIVFIAFIVIPPLTPNLSMLLFFSIFFLLSFMLAYFLGLNIVAVFALSILSIWRTKP